jgi:drug/metabolite transporter (DMT)-like permease
VKFHMWIAYAAVTALFLAVADSSVKLAAGRLSSSLGLLIYGACTFSTGLGWVLWQYFHGDPFHAQASGVLFAMVVGVAFSAVTVGLYATFAAGAPISIASPVVRLGGLIVASVVGIAVLREPFSLRYVAGMLLVLLGLYLILTR